MTDETTTAVEELPDHLERQPGWICTGCDHVSPDEPDQTLYECGDDGNFVSDEGNRCPECNKFASKVGPACDECEDAEMEEGEIVYCSHCDEAVNEDDIEEHLHEDEQDDIAEEATERKQRVQTSPNPVPITVEVPVETLRVGDWYAYNIPSATSDDLVSRTVEITHEPRVNGNTVMISNLGYTVGTKVQKITGWDRPTAAHDIKASELTLLHTVLNPADWSPKGREAYTEIRTDLATGTQTCFNRYRSKTEPVRVYHPGDTLTVVDRDKDDLFGKPAFEVWWEVPVVRVERVDGDPFGHPTELGEAFAARLVTLLGTPNTVGRKHYISERGGHSLANDKKPYARFIERKPKVTTAFLEILRDLDLGPTTLIQTTVSR